MPLLFRFAWGFECLSSFLLQKEFETKPGLPEFLLVCSLITGLRGRREGGREEEREEGEKSGWGRDQYVSL
jgi:hypothetical protein